MDEVKYSCNCIFGHVEPKTFHTFENGRMTTYGYSIRYDQNGKEVSRTEPTALGSLYFDNGTPFTEDDYIKLKS